MKRQNYTSPVMDITTFVEDVMLVSGPDNFGEYIWGEEGGNSLWND